MRILTPLDLSTEEALEGLRVVQQLELMCRDRHSKIPLMKLHPWQSAFLADVFGALYKESRKEKPGLVHIRLQGAYGTGKTTIMVYITLLTLLFWKKYLPTTSKFKGAVLSGSKDQLKQVFWNDLKSMAHNYNFIKHLEVTETACRLIENPHCSIQCRVAHKVNVNSLTGIHADFVVVILDECPAIIDEVDVKIENYFTSALGLRIDAGNPLGQAGFFRRQLDLNLPGINKYIISREDLGPLENDGYARRIADQYGKDSDCYRVSVLGEYAVSSTEAFIPESAIISSLERKYDTGLPGCVYMGIDVAGGDSQDYSTYVIRDDYKVQKLYRNKLELALFQEKVFAAIELYDPEVIVVDAVGMGTGLFQEIRSRYKAEKLVVGFRGNSEAYLTERFGNRITEIYYNLREWLQYQGRIDLGMENMEVLLSELRLWEATTCSAKGLWTLVSKKQLHKSPDLADAFALTFAAKKGYVQKMTDYQKRQSRKRYI